MSFLEKYYSGCFVHNTNELKECISKIPNKELSEALLQAVENNREPDTMGLITKAFNVENIIRLEGKRLGEKAIIGMLDALVKIPFEAYAGYFNQDKGFSVYSLLAHIDEIGLKIRPQVRDSLEEAKKFSRACPSFFCYFDEENECEVGEENCEVCWKKFFQALDEEKRDMMAGDGL